MSRRTRAWPWSVLVVAVLTGASLAPSSAPAVAAPAGPALTGYVESGDGPAAVASSLPVLATVGVDGVDISVDGTSVGSPDADARRLLQQAHAADRRAELLVGNFSASLGDFDEPAAYRLLRSPARRTEVVQRLVTIARGGWDGIHLDFESLQARDRAGLTAFTRQLRQALPASVAVSMAVMASGDVAGYRAAGYDLPALSASLDVVVLMAYDQHGPGWTDAGPVGGLPWVRTVLGALLTQVPATKVDLGVAGYGYTWPAAGDGTQLSDAEARRTARTPTWDTAQAEWHGTLPGGGELWWSDRRSLQVREQLARSRGLHGVAVWSLGLSDPLA